MFTSILENSRATSSFVVAMPVLGFDFPLPTASWLLPVEGPGRGEKGVRVGSRDVGGSRLVVLVVVGTVIGSPKGFSTFVRSVMDTFSLSVPLELAGSC